MFDRSAPGTPVSLRPRVRASAPCPLITRALVLVLALGLVAARSGDLRGQDFLPFQVDEQENRVLLEIPADRLGEDILYQNTLATGFGTLGLGDRGQVGLSAVLRFERRGPRVLVIRENLGFRALGDDEELARTVEESFPSSAVEVLPVEEEGGGRLVVDATSFFLGDVFNTAGRLRGSAQGAVSLDRERSWVDGERSGAFPRNTEIRAVLTFSVGQPTGALNRLAPDGQAVTVEQHHSLLALPDPEGLRPRPGDGRAGLFSTSFRDFSQGIDSHNYQAGYTARWRLVPSDTAAYLRGELVEPVEPIVYYIDPGIPEPYRSAFIEGGMWWNDIFEAAGFRNAFEIRDLPEGANPLDARYPIIYWVHRESAGPSVGPSFRDPRTGEILNTVVRMDSHRSLQNYNIWAGLLPAAGPDGLGMSAEEFTMARRKQHSAHEVGHTLGVAHNFIAASQGRSSVMDYPAPLIDLDGEGRLDLSRAYRDSGGAWDSLAVRYAYTWFPDEESEREGLERIVQEALDQGLRFITGGHAGSAGSHPNATQWVEGSTMFEALERTMRVRDVLVEAFDETAIEPGDPMSLLNQRFAHVYFHHRWALEGVTKHVGGMEFYYANRGDGQPPTRIVPAEEQRRALEMVLDALEPGALAVPGHIPGLIPPSPYGTDGSEIWIASEAGPAFDPLTLAGILSQSVLDDLLHPQRSQRLASFHARDEGNPSLHEVLETVVERTWGTPAAGDRGEEAVRRVVRQVALNALLDLGSDPGATEEVRAAVDHRLEALRERLEGMSGGGPEAEAHRSRAIRYIDRYLQGDDDPDSRSRFPGIDLLPI